MCGIVYNYIEVMSKTVKQFENWLGKFWSKSNQDCEFVIYNWATVLYKQ